MPSASTDFAESLAVRDLGFTHVRLHFELAKQSVYDDFQVQFAHTRDDGLTRFGVRIGLEGGIFFRKFDERDASSFPDPALVLGSMATLITGSGNSICSRTMGCFSSQSVSPVAVSFSPTMAQISPE